VTKECRALIRNIQLILHDENNPSDCATEPHDITHITDALRYFCVTRTLGPEHTAQPDDDDLDGGGSDYDEAMTGDEPDEQYIGFGGG
jgi:phage terminase large subunit